MAPDNQILVQLDRKRPVRWTKRAEARNASLPRPVTFGGLARGRNRLYVLCALLWSALVERDHEYEAPEDLAQYLETEDQQLAAFDCIKRMVNEAFPEKKTSDSGGSSLSGQGQSSGTSSAPQTGGT